MLHSMFTPGLTRVTEGHTEAQRGQVTCPRFPSRVDTNIQARSSFLVSPSSPCMTADTGVQLPQRVRQRQTKSSRSRLHAGTRAAPPQSDGPARTKVLTCSAMSSSVSFSGCPDPPPSCPATQGPPVSQPQGPQDRDSTGPYDNRQQAGKRFLRRLRVN